MSTVVGWITVCLVAVAAGIGIDACAGSLTSATDARQALAVQGFSHIQLKSRNIIFAQILGCDNQDAARYNFEVTNPAGKRVAVYVCEGWPFKGATVRYP